MNWIRDDCMSAETDMLLSTSACSPVHIKVEIQKRRRDRVERASLQIDLHRQGPPMSKHHIPAPARASNLSRFMTPIDTRAVNQNEHHRSPFHFLSVLSSIPSVLNIAPPLAALRSSLALHRDNNVLRPVLHPGLLVKTKDNRRRRRAPLRRSLPKIPTPPRRRRPERARDAQRGPQDSQSGGRAEAAPGAVRA